MEKDTYPIATLRFWIEKIKQTTNGYSICPKCETFFNDRYDGCKCDEI